MIDFGLVPSQSETKAVKLLVLNSGAKPIQIQNVIATPVTDAISINFKAVKVQPETLRPKVIAEMVFNRKLFYQDFLFCPYASKPHKHLQSLAVKLAICQLSKNRCCSELCQYKSVVNTSFEGINNYL